MAPFFFITLCWAALLVAWILVVVRGIAWATPHEPVRPRPLLTGLTLLVCLPFLAVILPFQVPVVLCRGRRRLTFWTVTVVYHALLRLLAVLVLHANSVEAAVLLSLGCLLYGRSPRPGGRQLEGACSKPPCLGH